MCGETRREGLTNSVAKKFLDWSDRILMGQPMVTPEEPVTIPAQRPSSSPEDLHLLWEQAIANEDWEYAQRLEAQQRGQVAVQAEVEQ